jgi:hypothetical protein
VASKKPQELLYRTMSDEKSRSLRHLEKITKQKITQTVAYVIKSLAQASFAHMFKQKITQTYAQPIAENVVVFFGTKPEKVGLYPHVPSWYKT